MTKESKSLLVALTDFFAYLTLCLQLLMMSLFRILTI
jgi:hypothetical protein